jgi:predicted nicotinamide N-methyase
VFLSSAFHDGPNDRLHLARHLLSQHFFPPPEPLLSLEKLRVLELGAGTGVLAALLGPLCMSYIATDQPANTRLVEKNISVNSGAIKRSALGSPATIVSLDWMDVTTARKRATTKGHVYAVPEARDVDLVLAVDCIYNEALVQPLVDTLAATCSRGAIAWVVVELRSSDVVSPCLSNSDSLPFRPQWVWAAVRIGTVHCPVLTPGPCRVSSLLYSLITRSRFVNAAIPLGLVFVNLRSLSLTAASDISTSNCLGDNTHVSMLKRCPV